MPCGDGTGPLWGRRLSRSNTGYRMRGYRCRGWGIKGFSGETSGETDTELLRERLRFVEAQARRLKKLIEELQA